MFKCEILKVEDVWKKGFRCYFDFMEEEMNGVWELLVKYGLDIMNDEFKVVVGGVFDWMMDRFF